MALQVWLPLVNNINNQGLYDSIITQNGITYTDGKFGKSATFSNSYISIKNTPITGNISDFSFSFWMKNSSPSDTACLYNGRTTTGGACAIFALGGSFRFDDGAQHSLSYAIPQNKWEHYCFTRNAENINLYVNGKLIQTVVSTDFTCSATNATIGASSVNSLTGSNNWFTGQLNDYRIYDHCLSPKEIKLLAQGMVCHYPLNDSYSTSSINKYSNTVFDGKASSIGNDITVTQLTNERGYNYKYTYTGNGSNYWKSIQFPVFTFTAGKKYDYSCKVRCNSCTSNVIFQFRAARMSNDWVAQTKTTVSSTLADGKWHEYHTIITLEDKSERAGTTYDTKPLIEFYTNSMATKDAVFSFDFDLKDVQISECDVNASVSNGNWNDGIIYDTSGFNNHGSVTSSSKPSWSDNSQRYNGCYKFNGSNNFIALPQSTKICDEIAISMWGYMDTWNGNGRLVSCTEGGGWNIESNSNKISFLVYVKGVGYKNCTSTRLWSSLSSGWHHFAVTYNGLKSCLYIDGILDTTIICATTKTQIQYNSNNTIFIGAEAGNDVITPVGNYFNGKVSDFRLYCTALSAQDIQELYNTPVSLTNSGTFITQGEFVEND